MPCWNCSDMNSCDWQQATWQPSHCVYRSVQTDTLRRCLAGRKVTSALTLCYINPGRLLLLLLCPRPRRGGGGIRRSSASVVRLSVCPSDVAYMGSNSKTKRPRKTTLCTGVPQVTCDSHTDFKVKRSKVKVTGRRHIVAAT